AKQGLPAPVVILFCRLVCKLVLARVDHAVCAEHVQRHILMLAPAILSLVDSFVDLVLRRELQEASPSYHLSAVQAVLDAVLALVGLGGVFGGGTVPRDFVEGLVARFECDVHPAVLARLSLCHLGLAIPVGAELLRRFQGLEPPDQAVFWQQAKARSRLLFSDVQDVQKQLQHLQDAGFEGFEWSQEMPQQTGQCDEQFPSLPPLQDASPLSEMPFEEPAGSIQCSFEAEIKHPSFLGVLDLPALPLPAPAARHPKPSRKHLGRGDIARLRGVDPKDAPEELRCAIDGKLMAAAQTCSAGISLWPHL
ncbi:unnamed protein product, partial [Symbiodinium natans]